MFFKHEAVALSLCQNMKQKGYTLRAFKNYICTDARDRGLSCEKKCKKLLKVITLLELKNPKLWVAFKNIIFLTRLLDCCL